MDIDIEFGEEETQVVTAAELVQDPDEFLARNSFRIVYHTNNLFLHQIRDLIVKREAINLRPEYQRRLRWTNFQKTKLVESFLLNIPIPPVFFYEADAARYEVVDGQQRLNTIREFFDGDFALSGLRVLKPLNGLRYNKCPPRVKRTLDRASLSAIVLLMESESELPSFHSGEKLSVTDIRRLVFNRLNTGGRQLNAQEIRSALNPGNLNKCILQLSRFEPFTSTFGIPPYTEDDEEDYYEIPGRQKNCLYASMRDCELVLRFFALRDPRNIRGSMKAMLDRTMETKFSEEQAERLATDYRDRFQFLYDLFDSQPFKIVSKTDEREKVSAALYDASMVALDRVWDRRAGIQDNKAGVFARLEEAIESDASYELIVGRRNTADSVKGRIDLLQEVLLPE